MSAVYNENDPFAAEWLRNLIKAGLIAPGDVDTRSIIDVGDDDYRGYVQVHLFAGIGGWSYAARLAGWPDSKPIWTGSCPCQPFSAAGKRKGAADARHLWPEMRRLIRACRPEVVAGEQVASKDGRLWLAGVRADLEDLAYEPWAADICSAGTGAPHIRQRIWWMADTDGGLSGHGGLQPGGQHGQQQEDGGAGRVADDDDRRQSRLEDAGLQWQPVHDADGRGESGRLGEPSRPRLEGRDTRAMGRQREAVERTGPLLGFWSAYDIVHCTDGKARRTGPGIFPLAHGVPNRVGLLRGAGNAINPWLAAEVLMAYLAGPTVENVDNAA